MPVSDDELMAAVEAYVIHGTKAGAAAAIGLPISTFRGRLDKAARRGMLGTRPVLEGFEIARTSAELDERGELRREWVQQRPERTDPMTAPDGHVVKGVSALIDSAGNVIQQWVKTREGLLDPLEVADRLKAAFADYETPHRSAAPPVHSNADLLNLMPCNDWHINLQIWGREASENWDLKIAERTIGDGITETIARLPAAAHGIVLGGGDLLHADDNSNRTAKSGHVLQADQRHQKGLETAIRLKVRTIDAALLQHDHVTVRILPGNHDEQSSVAVTYYLMAHYRHDPRVTVDADPSLFFWHRFGSVMIGATHGHTVKLQDMPQIMAHRRAEDWGATRYRYIHGFHVHHKQRFATEGEGVVMESHQAPIPMDAWHHGSGYLSGRSFQAITYHSRFGEVGRVRQAVMDAT